MIRKFRTEDLTRVMNIWLNTNMQAHSFISPEYWQSNYDLVNSILPEAEIYVYESQGIIEGFMGMDKGLIAGIFVSDHKQSQGIGKQLLNKSKELYPTLRLSVYAKNTKAYRFYLREGFVIGKMQVDDNTGETEYQMIWKNSELAKLRALDGYN